MSRPKNPKQGRRASIWLDYESDQTAKQIDNLSEFIRLALNQASGIMAFDIIKKAKGLPDHAPPTQEQLDTFNANHPLDPLTAKRKNKWPNTPNSPPTPEPW